MGQGTNEIGVTPFYERLERGAKMKKFLLHKLYSRKEIGAKLGGNQIQYLPDTSGKVVCGCFDKKKNPAAPEVILVGVRPKTVKTASMLSSQSDYMPVFVFKAAKKWEYVGNYKFKNFEKSPKKKRAWRDIAERNISRVMYLSLEK